MQRLFKADGVTISSRNAMTVSPKNRRYSNFNKNPTNWSDQARRHATKIRPDAVGGIFGHFPNFDKCRPEKAGDVIAGVAVEYIGMDVCVKFGILG